MTDQEIQELNILISKKMGQPLKPIYVTTVTEKELKLLLRDKPMYGDAEAWGASWTSGSIAVLHRWRWIVAHEIAHVYGADESIARTFEDI